MDTFLLIARILSWIFIFAVVFIDKKKPESTIAWVLVLLFLPYVGVILYILLSDTFRLGTHKKERNKMIENKELKENLELQMEFIKSKTDDPGLNKVKDLILLNNNSDNFVSSGNEVKTYNLGQEMFDDLIKDIMNAKSFIHISYYIIRKDEYGQKLKQCLLEKLKEGVEVRLIYDHIGSRGTSMRFFKELVKEGAIVKKFFPSVIGFKPYLNHRNHRKMVIIDGDIGYTGGMNIGREYCNKHKKMNPWGDRHVRIHGNAVNNIQLQFFKDYLFVSKEKIDFENPSIRDKYFHEVKTTKGNKIVQTVASGPDYEDENIKDAYLKMVNNARHSIVIESPYLALDDSMMDAIRVAIKSGVDVTVVIPGVPDKFLVYQATLAYTRELIKMGAHVYAYKGFMHSKVLICDDLVTSIGSANMDRRSFSLNFEFNTFVYDKDFNKENRELVKKDIEDSEYLNDSIKKKNKFGLWLERIIRLFAPLI